MSEDTLKDQHEFLRRVGIVLTSTKLYVCAPDHNQAHGNLSYHGNDGVQHAVYIERDRRPRLYGSRDGTVQGGVHAGTTYALRLLYKMLEATFHQHIATLSSMDELSTMLKQVGEALPQGESAHSILLLKDDESEHIDFWEINFWKGCNRIGNTSELHENHLWMDERSEWLANVLARDKYSPESLVILPMLMYGETRYGKHRTVSLDLTNPTRFEGDISYADHWAFIAPTR
jgi:hypothetical protein